MTEGAEKHFSTNYVDKSVIDCHTYTYPSTEHAFQPLSVECSSNVSNAFQGRHGG